MKKFVKPIAVAVAVLILLALAYIVGGGNDGGGNDGGGNTAEPTVDASGALAASTDSASLPPPMEAEGAVISDIAHTCTLSVRCDTLLERLDALAPEIAALIPTGGALYSEREVTFFEGESVFNLLAREMKQNGIHLEYVNTPLYGSAYIEGIGNLYEFDCGELSGWMYKVNGIFPNYGCSRYRLKEGDRVEWVYTCDLGRDVGCSFTEGNYDE